MKMIFHTIISIIISLLIMFVCVYVNAGGFVSGYFTATGFYVSMITLEEIKNEK
jgi:hypothetical protein